MLTKMVFNMMVSKYPKDILPSDKKRLYALV